MIGHNSKGCPPKMRLIASNRIYGHHLVVGFIANNSNQVFQMTIRRWNWLKNKADLIFVKWTMRPIYLSILLNNRDWCQRYDLGFLDPASVCEMACARQVDWVIERFTSMAIMIARRRWLKVFSINGRIPSEWNCFNCCEFLFTFSLFFYYLSSFIRSYGIFFGMVGVLFKAATFTSIGNNEHNTQKKV